MKWVSYGLAAGAAAFGLYLLFAIQVNSSRGLTLPGWVWPLTAASFAASVALFVLARSETLRLFSDRTREASLDAAAGALKASRSVRGKAAAIASEVEKRSRQ